MTRPILHRVQLAVVLVIPALVVLSGASRGLAHAQSYPPPPVPPTSSSVGHAVFDVPDLFPEDDPVDENARFAVLRGDAWLYSSPQQGASKVRPKKTSYSSIGFVVEALDERGPWVSVNPRVNASARSHCGDLYFGFDSLKLQLWVRRVDLLRVLTEPYKDEGKGGAKVEIDPGAVVTSYGLVTAGAKYETQVPAAMTGWFYKAKQHGAVPYGNSFSYDFHDSLALLVGGKKLSLFEVATREVSTGRNALVEGSGICFRAVGRITSKNAGKKPSSPSYSVALGQGALPRFAEGALLRWNDISVQVRYPYVEAAAPGDTDTCGYVSITDGVVTHAARIRDQDVLQLCASGKDSQLLEPIGPASSLSSIGSTGIVGGVVGGTGGSANALKSIWGTSFSMEIVSKSGLMTTSQVHRVFQKKLRKLESCARARDTQEERFVDLEIVVKATGKATATRTDGSKALSACLNKVVKKLHFPKKKSSSAFQVLFDAF